MDRKLKLNYLLVGSILGGVVLLIILILISLKFSQVKKTAETSSILKENQGNNNQSISGYPSEEEIQNLISPPKKWQTIKVPPAKSFEKSAIAEKAINCLNKMKDQRGAYLFERLCDSSGNCKNTEGNHSGPRPIWARFKHYQKTKNKTDLLIIDEDLSTNLNEVNVIQNDFWNCKLMHELWESNLLSETEKKSIKDLCLYSLLRPSSVDEADKQINLGLVNKPNFRYLKNKFSQQNTTSIKPILIKNNLLETAFYSSEFVGKSYFTKQNIDLKRAEFFFNQATEMAIRQQKEIRYNEICTLGEASLDLFKATKDNDYLDFAKYLWINKKIYSLDYDFSGRTVCAYFANSLYQITKDIKYQKTREELLASLVSNNLDEKNRYGYVNGDGCFNSDKNEDKIRKPSNENALIIGMLLSD